MIHSLVSRFWLVSALGAALAGCRSSAEMSESAFWSIVDDVHKESALDGSAKYALMVARLSDLPPKTVVEFASWQRHFEYRVYREDIWDAMEILYQGCGDSSFHWIRGGLVLLGRDEYERISEDPGVLIEYANERGLKYFKEQEYDLVFWEALGDVSADDPIWEHELDLEFTGPTHRPEGYTRERDLAELIAWDARGRPGTRDMMEVLEAADPAQLEKLGEQLRRNVDHGLRQ